MSSENPSAPLIEGNGGELYGTTYGGGIKSRGTVFKIAKDGSGLTVIHHFFATSTTDGQNPESGVIEASNGLYFGTTYEGGSNSSGTIYCLSQDGTQYSVVHNFGYTASDGRFPKAGVLQASDGSLYGTTSTGGSNNLGTVFKLATDGNGYTILHHFTTTGSDGRTPQCSLIEASDGMLYGTTTAGGSNNYGIVFRLSKSGDAYSIVHHFVVAGADGRMPTSHVVEGMDLALYGTTSTGGSNNFGTVFKLNHDGSGYTNLHHFSGVGDDGETPLAGLLEGTNGDFYGTTSAGGSNNVGSVFYLGLNGATYTNLFQFSSSNFVGEAPQADLLLASDGFLYGTTYNGGTNNVGTLFSLQTDGSLFSTILSFSGHAGDGAGPQGGVILGSNNILYGTSRSGGVYGNGTIYGFNAASGAYTVFHSFTGTNGDGSSSWGNLILASDGYLYGTTHAGGSNGVGTIFKLNTNGMEYNVLYSFLSSDGDGASPASGLLEGSDGALYGTTYYGGSSGNGTVFRCTKDLKDYAIIHSFTNGDGASPEAALMQGKDGALYGTTYYGGSMQLGMAFKLNLNGSGYTNLHNFSGGGIDGTYPAAPLFEGSDGLLYGVTSSGGTNGASGGAVFRMDEGGSNYVVLYGFPTSGGEPEGGLVEGISGELWGTTYGGGSGGAGTIFSINKDGSGFSVLANLNGSNGRSPSASLARKSNGVFYGTAYSGGVLNSGMVFEIYPPETPDIISMAKVGGFHQVVFSGSPSNNYSMMRSTDLINWTNVITLTMPNNGIWTNSDNVSPATATFYRAAWLP